MCAFVIGFSGFSGAGKTTLIEGIIPLLKERGLTVAVIKHDAHEFDMDREGKDTRRFTKAGADEIMISSQNRSARISERARSLKDMIKDAAWADVILVEGYKDADIKRIGVASKRTDHRLPFDAKEFAAIADDDLSLYDDTDGAMHFELDDHRGITEWIAGEMMKEKGELTHFDKEGNAWMVDVSYKDITQRTACASAKVLVNEKTFELIKTGSIKKGDVLSVAQLAGIMGAKQTPHLIPLCHPVMTEKCEVKLKLNEKDLSVDIESFVKCSGKTGVEMEAICAASVAAMTVYDMCKAVQRDIVLTDIRLVSKTGGVHGDYSYEG